MHTPRFSRSPGPLQPPPALLCACLILRQAADAQETFRIELLEGRGDPSVAGQVSLSPLLNRASPDASSHSLPLPDDVRGCKCAGDYQERAVGVRGKGAAKSSVARARGTRASLRLVCLLPPSFCLSLFISASLSLSLSLPIKFGSLIQVFGSLIQVFGSLIQVFGSLIQRVWITDPRVWIMIFLSDACVLIQALAAKR